MQVAALAVELAQPYVHASCSPQNRAALLRYKLQCLLVGAHRLAETTLRNPYVRQRDRASQDVGDVSGPPQPRRAFGIRPVRCLQVPTPPGREPQQPRCPSTAEVVLFKRKIERPRACLTVPNASPRA